MGEPDSGSDHCFLARSVSSADATVRHSLPDDIQDYEGSISEGYVFKLPEIDISVTGFHIIQPSEPCYRINTRLLPRKLFYSLDNQLRSLVREYIDGDLRIFEFSMLILRMVEQAAAHLPKYHDESPAPVERRYNAEVIEWTEARLNQHGVDLSTVPNTAQSILGRSPEQICSDILPGYRIVHVESILRSDLCRRYLLCQSDLQDTLRNLNLNTLKKYVPVDIIRGLRGNYVSQHEELVQRLTQPKITFHGTLPHLIPSIVQHGFLQPDDVHPRTGLPLSVRCGSTYGRGIYSSPDPSFALMYSGWEATETSPNSIPGLKLIVCATIMGRSVGISRDDNWREQHHSYPGSDSHVANREKEYIVFHKAQILPCYVLHLDWGEVDDAAAFVRQQITSPQTKKTHPKLSPDVLSPGDKQRLKAERLAQAKKYFAYGFGPVSGRNIVIEEIAEVDDDEEDYGEYQQDRVEDATEVNIWSQWRLNGETSLDQYADARKAKNKSSVQQG